MSSLAASFTPIETEKLRLLYLRRRQVDEAISALEKLVEIRDGRANVITMEKIRTLYEAFG